MLAPFVHTKDSINHSSCVRYLELGYVHAIANPVAPVYLYGRTTSNERQKPGGTHEPTKPAATHLVLIIVTVIVRSASSSAGASWNTARHLPWLCGHLATCVGE